MQVDPSKPTLRAPKTNCSKLKSAGLVSSSAFKFSLGRYTKGTKSDPNSIVIDDCLADRITFWRIQPLKRSIIDEAYARLVAANNLTDAEMEVDGARRRSLLEAGELLRTSTRPDRRWISSSSSAHMYKHPHSR